MTLEYCEVGDKVVVWCIGTRQWDDVTYTIKSKFGLLFDLESYSGNKVRFVPNTKVKIA